MNQAPVATSRFYALGKRFNIAAVGQQALAGEAQQQAKLALQAQLAALPEPALRQRFLRMQRFGVK